MFLILKEKINLIDSEDNLKFKIIKKFSFKSYKDSNEKNNLC
jgi:hypothetical protein